MLQRGPIYVGDLKPLDVARPLAVVRPGGSLSSWATISISCLSTLTLLAAGAAWLVPQSTWISLPPLRHVAPVASTAPVPLSAFPRWIEVPHLSGPLSHADDPDTFSLADGPRTFLDPNPADTSEQTAYLPPRANPRLPLIGRAPLDAARLTHDLPPAWNELAERQNIATKSPPTAVATLEPNGLQPTWGRADAETTRVLPASPMPTAVPRVQPAQMPAPPEVVVRPAPTIAAAPPPGRVATLGPDPARQVVDRTTAIMPPQGAGAVVAPILDPGPARHARSSRRLRAVMAPIRTRAPYRDTEQTASITNPSRAPRARVDAGAVAHASLHRTRPNRPTASSTATAPSSPWTLPPALAPTD